MTLSKNTFQLAASYTIGSYLLPGDPIENISQIINSKVKVNIGTCEKIVAGIKNKEYDIGLIETPFFDSELIYKPWMENEMVFCSKTKLPNDLNTDLLKNYQLICREESSLTRELIGDFFKELGISHKDFKSIQEINNATALIQGVKWSKVSQENPTLTVVSKLAIEDEVTRKELFISRFKTHAMNHQYYIVYLKEKSTDSLIDNIVNYLINLQKDIK